MDFAVITVSNLIWIFYCLTEGVRESFFNHYKNTYRTTQSYNFKKMFFIQRMLVLLATGGIMFHTMGLISIPLILGQLLMFHFLHKLAYNCTVNKIESFKNKKENKKENKTDIKDPMVLLGISIQILVYIFFM